MRTKISHDAGKKPRGPAATVPNLLLYLHLFIFGAHIAAPEPSLPHSHKQSPPLKHAHTIFEKRTNADDACQNKATMPGRKHMGLPLRYPTCFCAAICLFLNPNPGVRACFHTQERSRPPKEMTHALETQKKSDAVRNPPGHSKKMTHVLKIQIV